MSDNDFERLCQILVGHALISAGRWAQANPRRWSHVAVPLMKGATMEQEARDAAKVFGPDMRDRLMAELAPLIVEIIVDPSVPESEREARAAEVGAGVFQRLFAPSPLPEN